MENELYHHGVKGQKWGVRRYQNKDGSLTLAGKKRALKMQDQYTRFSNDKKYRDKDGNLTYSGRKKALKMKEQYSELTGGKQLKKFATKSKQTVSSTTKSVNNSSNKSKSIKDMTDQELKDKIDRIALENKYKQAMSEQVSDISKKETSKGRKSVNEVLTNAGKNVATQAAVWAMGKVVNKAIEKTTGEKNAINPKKGQKDK